MKKLPYIGLAIALAAVVIVAGCTGKETRNYDEFATCLTDSGAVMYGTDWCPHCKDQKALFGDSFGKVNYVNCDADRDACSDAGVTGYPTWVIEGENYPGTKPLNTLAKLSGCSLTSSVGEE